MSKLLALELRKMGSFRERIRLRVGNISPPVAYLCSKLTIHLGAGRNSGVRKNIWGLQHYHGQWSPGMDGNAQSVFRKLTQIPQTPPSKQGWKAKESWESHCGCWRAWEYGNQEY